MEICDFQSCTGCSACLNTCQHNAIVMQQDKKGFLRPIINAFKCTSCGLCVKVCPVNTLTAKSTLENNCYSAKNRNVTMRQQSSSGGLFTVLSEYILSKGGVVFGAAFSDDCESVIHKSCLTNKGLTELRGSKYLQSTIGKTYEKAKEYLKKDKYVLFSGTPCQIAGLKNYLNYEYGKLITIDLVCHGVPSPLIFNKYTASVKQSLSCLNVKEYLFRCKDTGWSSSCTKVVGDNNQVYIADNRVDPFYATFNKDLFLRDCCHQCQYTSVERVSDITLADFWGYIPSSYKMRNDEKGISLLLVNTLKGEEIFGLINNKVIYKTEDLQMAIRGNKSLKQSWIKNPKSDEFWERIFSGEKIEEIMKSYYEPIIRKKSPKYVRILKSYKLFIPKGVIKVLKKFIR